ncbi:apolipoprotein A-II [Python bivittatus]|uniref:Apolipoprotein A-II n=1 Tax=Python bivittatus TaxID=176946 RepID=A0A9F2N826_PYTBI|nr:apolipoprotein A-II [Python bivittatus]XP_015743215.1 apolipoprotein A-II [Python bivittatus]
MKVFALMVLLISICCLEGALVKRQAEEPAEGEVSALFTTQVSDFIKRLQQQAEDFASSIKNSFGQERIEEIRSQAETILQQVQNSFTPLTEEMRQNLARLFPIPPQSKPPAQEGV